MFKLGEYVKFSIIVVFFFVSNIGCRTQTAPLIEELPIYQPADNVKYTNSSLTFSVSSPQYGLAAQKFYQEELNKIGWEQKQRLQAEPGRMAAVYSYSTGEELTVIFYEEGRDDFRMLLTLETR